MILMGGAEASWSSRVGGAGVGVGWGGGKSRRVSRVWSCCHPREYKGGARCVWYLHLHDGVEASAHVCQLLRKLLPRLLPNRRLSACPQVCAHQVRSRPGQSTHSPHVVAVYHECIVVSKGD